MSAERKQPKRYYLQGGRKDPLLIRVLEAENPDFRDALQSLQRQGAHLALQTSRKSPTDLIEAFDAVKNEVSKGQGKEGDVPVLTAKALVIDGSLAQGNTADNNLQQHIQMSRQGIQSLTALVATDTISPIDQKALATVNAILQKDPTVQRYAIHRLTWDLPEGEKDGLKKTFKIGAIADGVGFALEFLVPKVAQGAVKQLAEGAGLLTTGQSDDAVASYSNFKTERGGGKSTKQILKENKLTLGMMGVAGLLDFAFLPLAFTHHAVFGIPEINTTYLPSFIPHIHTPELALHTPFDAVTNQNWYWPTLTGTTFAFTAYAGSLTSKLSNINRSASTIKALDDKGLLPGRNGKAHTLRRGEAAWLGFIENQSHPFRVGLLAGIGLSTIASLTASFTGVLEGSGWSSTIQAGIGPLETISAFAAAWGVAEFGYAGYKKITDEQILRNRLKKAQG